MASKRQAVAALAAVSPEAVLTDSSCRYYYEVDIEAPPGHHWSNGLHCETVYWRGREGKPAFWAEVLSRVTDVGQPVKCTKDTCSVGLDGVCDYWEIELK